MIAVIFGTTGELIKLAPVLQLLEKRGAAPVKICTGQHVEQIPTLTQELGLPAPDLWLARGRGGRDVYRRADFPPWFATVAIQFARQRPTLRRRLAGSRPLVLVHGDTFTTVVGALMGRQLKATVAHLEAGLRSGDWRNPFPEELNRRVTSRLAGIHFAPGAETVNNLRERGVSGEIVDTRRNTVVDALAMVPARPPADLPSERFGIVSIHRFELLRKPQELRALLDLLHETSRATPLLFIDYPVTAAVIDAEGLADRFDERFRRIPRQRYFEFVSLLRASAFMLTDSGGSQEECTQLGLPCLVHRAATERLDGLDGGPVVLSRMNLDAVRTFLADPGVHLRQPLGLDSSPSQIVVEHLAAHGYT